MARREQSMGDEIPAWLLAADCFYQGKDPALAALVNVAIKGHEVEARIPVGARDDVVTESPTGMRQYPWRGVAITEYDDAGHYVAGEL